MKTHWSVVAVLVLFTEYVWSQENNVCPTFEDYYTVRNNSRCWYDLAAEYNVVGNILIN